LTLKCLQSLSKQDHHDFSIVLCDDGSTDGTGSIIAERHPDVIIVNGDGNLWWTGATNRCIEYAIQHATDPSDCVVTLNNDLEVDNNYLSALANTSLKYPGALITSVGYDIKTRNMVSPGFRQNWVLAKARPIDPLRDHLPGDDTVAEVTHAAGRGTLIPLEVLNAVGLFDEKHLPHYGADFDLSYRAARAGHTILVCFQAPVYSHVEETGLTTIRKKFSPKGLYQYLTNMRSPANLVVHWWLAMNNCPKILLPTFLILNTMFIVGSYFRYHLKRL
jgi:GT2 family glycosyltransferase